MKKIRKFAHMKTRLTPEDEIKTSASGQLLSQYLRRSRRRCTPERYMVLSAAEAIPGHFTIESLTKMLSDSGRHVALATVYNTVQLLVDCGLLRRLRLSNDTAARYEVTTANHHHLLCTRCGKIKDVSDPALEELLKTRRFSAFTPESFALSVYGICSACARKARVKARLEKQV